MEELYIYTDCSHYLKDRILKWSSIISHDNHDLVFTQKYTIDSVIRQFKFDPEQNINQHHGEFIAIFNTLQWILNNSKEKNIKKATIYTDSENSFLSIYGHRQFKDRLTAMIKLNDLCKFLLKSLEEVGVDIQICWVPGHSDIYGNEIANKWTKKFTKSNNGYEII